MEINKSLFINTENEDDDYYEWEFDKNGILVFPDGTTLAGNYSGSTDFELNIWLSNKVSTEYLTYSTILGQFKLLLSLSSKRIESFWKQKNSVYWHVQGIGNAAVATGYEFWNMILNVWITFNTNLKGYGFSLPIVY